MSRKKTIRNDLTGKFLTNKQNHTFEVCGAFYKKLGSRVRLHYAVEFVNTGTVLLVESSNLRAGRAKDRYQPQLYGVACIGEPVKHSKQDRGRWDSMLARCYSTETKTRYECYKGVTVCDRWLCFEYFLEDLKLMDNYGQPLCDLDKDLTKEGNKVYCPEFCQLVPRGANRSAGAYNSN